MVAFALAAIIGLAFLAVIRMGTADLPEGSLAIPTEGSDLLALGHILTSHHLLSLEVFAATILLILVGGGVIARPEPLEGDTDPHAGPQNDPEAPC